MPTCSKKAKNLPELASTLAPAQRGDALELDEFWSFVLRKSNKAWVWLALCRRTRQVVAVAVGDRSEKTCRQLWERIPAQYRKKQAYTDFWEAYYGVVPERQHRPGGKEEGQTNHVERFNNTLRQRLGRFVRKTLSFSKCPKMHWWCLLLFLHEHNKACLKRLAREQAKQST